MYTNLIIPNMDFPCLIFRRNILFPILLLTFISAPHLGRAQAINLKQQVTIHLNNVPLSEAISQISASTGIKIVFGGSGKALSQIVSVNAEQEPLSKVLTTVVSPQKFTYTQMDNAIVIKYKKELLKQSEEYQRGTLFGIVKDASSGEYLPGASLLISDRQGKTTPSATDREGHFRIANLEYGTYTITVTNIGYASYSVAVQLDKNEVYLTITLAPSSYFLKDVVVNTQRSGQAKALNKQKNAINIINVVSEEQMQKFPDRSAVDALQRVPGVYVSRTFGEGRYVYIRGTDARFTTVSINGSRVATPEQGSRYTGLDYVSATQLSSIEVSKTPTPDLDGNAIGGTVNLVTRSAFDYNKKNNLNLVLGSGYNHFSQKPVYQGSFTYSTRLGKKQHFGLTFGANVQESQPTTQSFEYRWDDRTAIDGHSIPLALTQIVANNYIIKRTYYGGDLNLEYKLNENNRFYIGGTFNKRREDQSRSDVTIKLNKGKYVDDSTVTKAAIIRDLQARVENELISTLNAGGVHTFHKVKLDYKFNYSYGSHHKNAPEGQIQPEFDMDQKANLSIDFSNLRSPKYKITNLEDGYERNPANFSLANIDWRTEHASDKEGVGLFNLSIPYSLFKSAGFIKLGGSYRFSELKRNDPRYKYTWKGSQDILLTDFTNSKSSDFLDGYNFGPLIDANQVRNFMYQQRGGGDLVEEENYAESLGNTYKAQEKIYGSYLMTRYDISHLTILAGFRNEYTRNDYQGNLLKLDENGNFVSDSAINNRKGYNKLFPNLQLKYTIKNNTNVRLAFTSGIARPNYADLVPYFIVDNSSLEISKGNSSLNATTALNLDVLAEHYFSGIGILSGGFFYKDLHHIIYNRIYTQTGGNYDGYEVTEPVNGGNAKLLGFEVNWEQQFSFLPGFLKGFGIFANYTHTKATDVNLLYGRSGGHLPGQASDAANLALIYEKGKVSGRVSWNYSGAFIKEVGESIDRDRWTDHYGKWDLAASYKLFNGFEIFANINNFSSAPHLEYYGIRDRPYVHEAFSWWANAGIRWRL
ncbi:TonB-dependent receptor [Chitinophaga costaii]|uniref:TonB-dependent receptor n=1 Tax=Chitinophaga costaii TaxID=1335309 RepID=A0A1C4FU79_9BACT|nr:TonB-dependent receptor [Chitinophaga costaii]